MGDVNTPQNASTWRLTISLASIYFFNLLIYKRTYFITLGIPNLGLESIPEQVLTYDPWIFFISLLVFIVYNLFITLFKTSEDWSTVFVYTFGLEKLTIRPVLIITGIYLPLLINCLIQPIIKWIQPIIEWIQHFLFPQFNRIYVAPTCHNLTTISENLFYMLQVNSCAYPFQIKIAFLLFFLNLSTLLAYLIKMRPQSFTKISHREINVRTQIFKWIVPLGIGVSGLALFILPQQMGIIVAQNQIRNQFENKGTILKEITADQCICEWCNSNPGPGISLSSNEENGLTYTFNDQTRLIYRRTVLLGEWNDQIVLVQSPIFHRDLPIPSFYTIQAKAMHEKVCLIPKNHIINIATTTLSTSFDNNPTAIKSSQFE